MAVAAQLAAGAGLGMAHVDPSLAPLGWLGFVLLGLALARGGGAAPVMTGLALGMTADQWIGHPWHSAAPWAYGGGHVGVAIAIYVGSTLAHEGPKLLAVMIGWRLAGRAPLVTWLPAAWLAGEWLRDRASHLSYNDWLTSFWQVGPALRAVGWWGWWPTAWLGLAAAAATADALVRRDVRYALVPVGVAIALALLPARPTAPPGLLARVGAVHMTGYYHPPGGAPPGVRLVVWPEQSQATRPWIPEGPGGGKRIAPPFPAGHAAHLVGLVTRCPGGHQNAIAALAPDGRVEAMRAKASLFPLIEAPVAGVRLPRAFPMVAGTAPARLPTPLGPAIALVCMEGLERGYVQDQAAAAPDARLLTIGASEDVLAGSVLGMRQFVGASAMLAAMTGLPVVRSSLWGMAAIIDADGTVLAESEPGTDGVLTLAGDVVHHRPLRRALP